MSEQRAPAEALRKRIGAEGKSVAIEIEEGLIRKFAEAVEDTNPLWQDEALARKSRYGSIIAPPQLFCSAMISGSETRPELALPYKRILDGGEWEFLLPVKPGDVITSVSKFVDLREREGKSGKMAFLTFETTHRNQRDEVVAKSRTTLISLE